MTLLLPPSWTSEGGLRWACDKIACGVCLKVGLWKKKKNLGFVGKQTWVLWKNLSLGKNSEVFVVKKTWVLEKKILVLKNKTWLLQGKIRWPLRATVIFYLCLEVILFAVSLFLLLRGYFFCRDSCGPPYILLNKKQRIRMKKDYYSDNDLRFPCWMVAHSFQNVNFANAMFDSEFYCRTIIKNLRTLLRKWVEIR